jgi:hypothetical protein
VALQECASKGGTVVGSCPSGYVGCCTTPTAGYDETECYYLGEASSLDPICTGDGGTWTPG